MHRISPRPWINGSSASVLVDQMMAVHRALEAAAHEMRLWQPHGRDYPIGGDYKSDHAEYLRRLRLVEELAEQYESEAYSISKQEV
jgi:hypothetical protein